MSENMTITNYDLGGLVIGNAEYEDGLLTHSEAGTISAGTILGRITNSGKFVPYDSEATDGSEEPCAVLPVDSVADEAIDKSIRSLIGGKVRTSKVIDLNTGAAPADAVRDLLRKFGIICVEVDESNGLDNQ